MFSCHINVTTEFIRKKEPFNELATLGDAEKFPAWIFKIASNKCLNLIKHNKVLNVDSVNDSGEV